MANINIQARTFVDHAILLKEQSWTFRGNSCFIDPEPYMELRLLRHVTLDALDKPDALSLSDRKLARLWALRFRCQGTDSAWRQYSGHLTVLNPQYLHGRHHRPGKGADDCKDDAVIQDPVIASVG